MKFAAWPEASIRSQRLRPIRALASTFVMFSEQSVEKRTEPDREQGASGSSGMVAAVA